MYYKILFARGIRIDDDVIAERKEEARMRDTIEEYLEPEFRTRSKRN